MLLLMIALLLIGIIIVLYCCIRCGAKAEERFQKFLDQKEKDI